MTAWWKDKGRGGRADEPDHPGQRAPGEHVNEHESQPGAEHEGCCGGACGQGEGAGDAGECCGDTVDAKLAELEGKLVQAEAARLRALADFQNYQRRALANEQEAKVQGRTGVVQSLLSLLDHFDIALSQDHANATAEQILGGVRMIREEFIRVLQSQGVGLINPVRGEEFTPGRHEAIMQQAADGVPSGHVVSMFQMGYTLGDRVVRPAKVSVAP
jgi:molecular chaperone GrpE